MKLFNTLTRRKEEFVPLEEGKVQRPRGGSKSTGGRRA